MAFNSVDSTLAANKQKMLYVKTASRTAVAASPFSVFDLAGNPGAGTLAVGNTTSGIVPTDATTGYPPIDTFGVGATGVLNIVNFASSVACRLVLYDCLFSAGAFNYNASVTLSGQPSYASRVPGGTDFRETEIWLEAVTAFTGNQSIAITYTDGNGTSGRTTGTVATGVAPIVGRMFRLPLQAGSNGVQKIETITSTVSTAGTFNVHVMRRLWSGRVRSANDGDAHDLLKTGLPEVFDNSALRLVVYPDSTATGLPDLWLEIINA